MHVTLTVRFALSTDLAAAAKLSNSVVHDVDDILRTNLVHDVPVGAAHCLDAERARTKMDELALGGNARVLGGIGVIFNVLNDLQAVRDGGGGIRGLVNKARYLAEVLALGDVAGVRWVRVVAGAGRVLVLVGVLGLHTGRRM